MKYMYQKAVPPLKFCKNQASFSISENSEIMKKDNLRLRNVHKLPYLKKFNDLM